MQPDHNCDLDLIKFKNPLSTENHSVNQVFRD